MESITGEEQKKLPLRVCVVCNARQSKDRLLRLSDKKDLGIIFELGSGYFPNSKGIYICKKECIKQFLTHKKYKARYLNRMPMDSRSNLEKYFMQD